MTDTAETKPTPVDDRQGLNTHFVQVARLHFVERESYRLSAEPFGPGEKYKDRVGVELRTLSSSELKPAVARSLAEALVKAESGTSLAREQARRAAIDAYARSAALEDRWIYAYAQHQGKREFRYEIRIDKAGKVRHLTADQFAKVRADDPGLDNDRDEDYEKHPDWAGGQASVLEHVIPLDAEKQRLRWFFFGSSIRLADVFVQRLAKEDPLWAPEQGIDLLGSSILRVREKDLAGPQGSGTSFGVLVEVFNPMTLVRNLAGEYQARRDRYQDYLLPHDKVPKADSDRARHRAFTRAIASCVRVMFRASTSSPIALKAALAGAARYAEIRRVCFTEKEIERITALRLPGGSNMAWEQFLDEDNALQRLNIEELSSTAIVLMLLLTSRPWGFMEDVSKSSNARATRDAYRYVALCCDALSLLGDTNTGGRFLSELVDHIEQAVPDAKAPGVTTIRTYVMRGPNAPTFTDTAKTAFKAGTAPIALWSKLVSFYNAKNSAFLEKFFKASGVDTSEPDVKKAIGTVAGQQRVLALTCFTMQKNLSRVYGATVFQNTVDDILLGEKTAMLYLDKDAKGFPLGRVLTFKIDVDKNFAARIAELRNDTIDDPFDPPSKLRTLTFDNVSNYTGIVSLAFSVRSLALGIQENAPTADVAKAAFDVFKTAYGIPWVQKKLGERVSPLLLSQLSKSWALRVTSKGPAATACLTQAISWGFALHDFGKKLEKSSNESATISSLSLAAESLLLVSAGLAFGSGFTLAPIAAALAFVAQIISTAQFIYTLQLPEDDVKLAGLCLFGSAFHSGREFPHFEARDWMACPANDARFFNPEFTSEDPRLRSPFEAYGRQLGAFTNYLANFSVRVAFEVRADGFTGTLVILPGNLPRAAYFQVKLEVKWVKKTVSSLTSFDDDDLWGTTFEFRFYPDADTAPPPTVAQPRTPQITALHEAGIVDLVGGPLMLQTNNGDSAITIRFKPDRGLPVVLEGVLQGAFDDGKVGMFAKRKVRVRYRVRTRTIEHQGRFRLLGEIDLGSEVAVDLAPEAVAALIEVESNIDGGSQTASLGATGIAVFEVDAKQRKFGFEVDIGDNSFDRRGTLRQLEVRLKDGLGESVSPGPVDIPDSGVVDQRFHYRTTERHAYEIPYRATLTHTGKRFEVELVHGLARLRRVDDASKVVSDAHVVLDALVFQYARNLGEAAPLGQGGQGGPKGAAPLFIELRRVGKDPDVGDFLYEGGRTVADPVVVGGQMNDPSVRIGDELALRFTVGTKRPLPTPPNAPPAFSIEPWTEGVEMRWTWSTVAEAGNAGASTLVQLTRVAMHCVLDGDEDVPKFVPSATVDAGPPKAVDLDVELDVARVRMNADVTDYLVDPSSESVTALSKCKC